MKGALKVGSLQKPDGDGEGLSSSNRSAAGEAPGSNVCTTHFVSLLWIRSELGSGSTQVAVSMLAFTHGYYNHVQTM